MDLNCYNKIIDIYCSINIITSRNIEDLGRIISLAIFGGIPFEGLEAKVYDDVPAVFFKKTLLGLEVTLFGFSAEKDPTGYWLEIIPNHKIKGHESVSINIGFLIYFLLEDKMKEYNDIEIRKPRFE